MPTRCIYVNGFLDEIANVYQWKCMCIYSWCTYFRLFLNANWGMNVPVKSSMVCLKAYGSTGKNTGIHVERSLVFIFFSFYSPYTLGILVVVFVVALFGDFFFFFIQRKVYGEVGPLQWLFCLSVPLLFSAFYIFFLGILFYSFHLWTIAEWSSKVSRSSKKQNEQKR